MKKKDSQFVENIKLLIVVFSKSEIQLKSYLDGLLDRLNNIENKKTDSWYEAGYDKKKVILKWSQQGYKPEIEYKEKKLC